MGAAIAALMLVLVLLEPDILEAPFENERTILFTVGGTAIAALAFVAMLAGFFPARKAASLDPVECLRY